MEFLVILLVTAVVFVNGWTDAPNAITGVVATGALPYGRAVRLAAVCNLAGIAVMGAVSTSVADTIFTIVDFGDTPGLALAALSAAMASIVLFAAAAWWFGIPTSESHALVAGLTGAALALGGLERINPAAWGKVLWGLAWSLFLGAGLGFLFARLLRRPLERLGEKGIDRLQVLGAGGMAFLHGAQDGQKFVAVFVIAHRLAGGLPHLGAVSVMDYPWVMAVCAAVMALGTLSGGRRIINRVGEGMVTLQKPQSVCSDLGSAVCLLAASLWGIPMSTTHTKTMAILGAGLATNRRGVRLGNAGGIVGAWAITFPACGAMGYLFAHILIRWWA